MLWRQWMSMSIKYKPVALPQSHCVVAVWNSLKYMYNELAIKEWAIKFISNLHNFPVNLCVLLLLPFSTVLSLSLSFVDKKKWDLLIQQQIAMPSHTHQKTKSQSRKIEARNFLFKFKSRIFFLCLLHVCVCVFVEQRI